MKLTLHKAAARQLYASPALHVAETGHKPDFRERNMSKHKCTLLSCRMDAITQAKLALYKVRIPAKRKEADCAEMSPSML
jgi:hypothetical protein